MAHIGRGVRWRIACAVALAVGVVPAVAGEATTSGCQTVRTVGTWTQMPPPTLPSVNGVANNVLTDETSVGLDPSTLLATDGDSLYRSPDAGCHWAVTFSVSGVGDYVDSYLGPYVVGKIATSHGPGPIDKQVVYLVLQPSPLSEFSGLFVAPPDLFAVSHDGGVHFSVVPPNTASSVNGTVPDCVVAPTLAMVPVIDPNTLMFYCQAGVVEAEVQQQEAGQPDYIYVSHDGAGTWSLMGMPSGQGAVSIVTDPNQPSHLWVAGRTGTPSTHDQYLAVWRTLDSGAHWERSLPLGQSTKSFQAASMALDTQPGAGYGNLAIVDDAGSFLVSHDHGSHWVSLRVPGTPGGWQTPSPFYVNHTLYVRVSIGLNNICDTAARLLKYPSDSGWPTLLDPPHAFGRLFEWGGNGKWAAASGGRVMGGFATLESPGIKCDPTAGWVSFAP